MNKRKKRKHPRKDQRPHNRYPCAIIVEREWLDVPFVLLYDTPPPDQPEMWFAHLGKVSLNLPKDTFQVPQDRILAFAFTYATIDDDNAFTEQLHQINHSINNFIHGDATVTQTYTDIFTEVHGADKRDTILKQFEKIHATDYPTFEWYPVRIQLPDYMSPYKESHKHLYACRCVWEIDLVKNLVNEQDDASDTQMHLTDEINTLNTLLKPLKVYHETQQFKNYIERSDQMATWWAQNVQLIKL